MKAVVLDRYGPPEQLRIAELPLPRPGRQQVLVRVHATAVNDWDWCFVRGKPYIYRLMFGLRRPKVRVLGAEIAGTVVEPGPGSERFQPGDRVYGDVSEAGFGGFAEFACLSEGALHRVPHGMSFEQAAALPHAAPLALQGLVDLGRIQSGETVLINGAGGGVGAIGLQIAKAHGAHVTGVDAGVKLRAMRELGFDEVIDFTSEDFTRSARSYDLILDTKSDRWPWHYLRALKPKGRYVTVGGKLPKLLAVLCAAPVVARLGRKSVAVLALKPNHGLETIGRMFEAGSIRALIDGPHTLEQVPEAIARFGRSEHKGKIVIAVTRSSRTE